MKFFVKLEDNKVFNLIIQVLFSLSSVISLFYLFKGNYYVILITFISWNIFILIPYYFLFEKRNIEHAYKDFTNILDGPIDGLKHKIHGMKLFGKTIYLPQWLMKGSGKENK